jgi:hypothetical protein
LMVGTLPRKAKDKNGNYAAVVTLTRCEGDSAFRLIEAELLGDRAVFFIAVREF